MLELARGGRGRDERRARPPRDLRLAGRGPRGLPRVPRGRAAGGAVGPPRRRRPPGAGARRGSCSTSRARCSRPAARGSRGAASTSRLAVPGAHNARNAAAALEACVLAGADPAAGRGGTGRLRRRRAPVRAPRDDAVGRGRRRRLRAPPDRGRGDDRRGPDARRTAGRGRLPTAPLLAHRPAGGRLRRGAGAGRRRGRARRLPGARAGRGLPRHLRASRSPRRRPTRRPAAASCGCRTSPRPSACSARSCTRATSVSSSGRGTWTTSAGGSSPPAEAWAAPTTPRGASRAA